jgi:hypothetical protein
VALALSMRSRSVVCGDMVAGTQARRYIAMPHLVAVIDELQGCMMHSRGGGGCSCCAAAGGLSHRERFNVGLQDLFAEASQRGWALA